MLSPGGGPMQPADLSAYDGISFWFKSEAAGSAEKPFTVMIFTRKRGFQPSFKLFNATEQWKKHSYDFADFDGSDGSDVMGIWFGTNQPGEFEFQLDSVKIEVNDK